MTRELFDLYFDEPQKGLENNLEGNDLIQAAFARLEGLGNNMIIQIDVPDAVKNYVSIKPLLKSDFKTDQETKIIKNELSLFNAFSCTEGFFIDLHDKKIKGETINVTFFDKNPLKKSFFYPKIRMRLAEGVRVGVTIKYHGMGDEKSFINNVFEIYCHKNSKLKIYNLKMEKNNSFILDSLNCTQEQNSLIELFYFSFGSKYIQNNIMATLAKPKAKIVIKTLNIAKQENQIRDFGKIEHLAAHTESKQLFKTVLFDKAKTEFKVEVKIEKKARKSVAEQLNRNLLLSEKAKAVSRPQMRILNPDVDCHHGASIGQFDDEELFYFLSRGINREEAKKMLTLGFCAEVLEGVSVKEIKEKILGALTPRPPLPK
jgi:Fe-S cluster assembly protein SufD